jgi:adenine/guanine/hypoxanthine permease
VAGGIGLFIAFIGLHNAGLIGGDAATLVSLGNVRAPAPALALFGLLVMTALEVKKVRGSILIGVLATTALAWALGLTHWTPATGNGFAELAQTAGKLDIGAALGKGVLEIVFVFFFVDLFDNLGTLVAVTKRAGLISANHQVPRLNRILFADATATVFGSFTGTSTVTSYIESSAGIAAGGRSGVTAIVTGLLFLGAIAATPFVGFVPTAATAPALILVGALMLSTIAEVRWSDPLAAVPAFLTLVMIPFTSSIANGLGFGVIAWAAIHLFTGHFRKKEWLLYVLAVLFLARFVYLGAG